jgi:hypothetical protein
MTANYVLLEKITVGAAGAASVTFSGIPQTGYTDLVVSSSARSIGTNGVCVVYFNNDTTNANYSVIRLRGTGSTVGSEAYSAPYLPYTTQSNFTASGFSNSSFYVPNYTSSNYKSISSDDVTENNATLGYQIFTAGLWNNTASITSIKIQQAVDAGFAEGSTFYLYGVAALGTTPAIVPYATGGDTIMTDGTYWYHTFVSSGTFTPQKAISCDYLVVAGGAGGGGGYGGGGGAGGLRSTVTATGGGGSLESALSLLSETGYTVTVGAGGAGGYNSEWF